MKRRSFIFFVFFFCFISLSYSQKYTLSGYVKEANSQELLLGTTVYIPELQTGTTANAYGFYSITVPEGKYTVEFSFVGYQTKIEKFILDKNIDYNVVLSVGEELEEVVITADKINKQSEDVRTSVMALPVQQIKEIPSFMGEKDVLKVIQLMPGVQKATEGQSGIYVRGGSPDQNLLVLDDAPVYNAQHLFGFFSVFNGDALRGVEVIKGGFPARYGGRLSSVIDMNMKDGNKEHYTGELGVGIVSTRGVFEGPIVKDKASFLISARRTYIDILAKPIIKANTDGNNVGYYFYDLNAKVNCDINDKNKIYLSGYFGRDVAYGKEMGDDSNNFRMGWGNQTGTLRWNHQFSNKLFANTSVIYSKYDFLVDIDPKEFKLKYSSGIEDIGGKIDFNYYPSPKHTLHFGLASTCHAFTPRALVVESSSDFGNYRKENKISTIESGVYVEDLYKPFNRLQILAGLRYSNYKHKDKFYDMLEPRISASYKLAKDFAVKASYAKMQQYIHLLSNTGVGLPTDLWVPSTEDVKPQKSWQVAGGFAKDFPQQNLSLTIEGYYKRMNDIISYKEGASFLYMNDSEVKSLDEIRWEDNITRGKSWSYGAEFLLQRKVGKLTGWLGYTLSWTKLQFPELNFGEEFWAKYDRRHDFSAVFIYNITKNIKVGATWVYATGNAITLPLSQYSTDLHQPHSRDDWYGDKENIIVDDYEDRNQFRMKDFHRLDFNIQFSKEKKHGTRVWEISIYNVYNRKNPYFYYVEDYEEETKVKQVSLFPILPSVTYVFKFK
ncbi:MAG: TonB-dependent receptor [Bacteroidales bacterium]|nr:TonB-dependent receptor [Bacteroidales bacterium]